MENRKWWINTTKSPWKFLMRTSEMRWEDCRDWGWPCENTSLISDKLISLSKINFNLQTVEMWGHSQTEQCSGFIWGRKRFCWSGWSDSSIYSHIDICFNIFKSKTHLASPSLSSLSSLPSPPSSPLLPFSRLCCISWLFVDMETPAVAPESLLPPNLVMATLWIW